MKNKWSVLLAVAGWAIAIAAYFAGNTVTDYYDKLESDTAAITRGAIISSKLTDSERDAMHIAYENRWD